MPDLVPRGAVRTYPTGFAAMTKTDLDAVVIRGEQLTRSLIYAYIPALDGW